MGSTGVTSLIKWDAGELATMMPTVQKHVARRIPLAVAFEKAQRLLMAHRRRSYASIKASCRPGEPLERAFTAVNGYTPAVKVVAAAKRKPQSKPAAAAPAEVQPSTRVFWTTREWQMVGLGLDHWQPMHPNAGLAACVFAVQNLVMAPDRRRKLSSLYSSVELRKMVEEGKRDAWQLTEETREFVVRAIHGETTGEAEAEAVETVAKAQTKPTITVELDDTPPPAPPVQSPPAPPVQVATRQAATPTQQVNAEKVAAILAGTASQLFDVFNVGVAEVIQQRMQPVVDMIAHRMAAIGDGIIAQVREATSKDLIRRMVHDFMNAELGGLSVPPSAPVIAPAPAPEAAPAGPTFTLGDEVPDPMEAAMRASINEYRQANPAPEPVPGPRIKVDIVGLDGKAKSVIQNHLNGTFLANYVSDHQARGAWQPRENVVVWTRTASMYCVDAAKRAGSRVLIASGGINSVLQRLDELKKDRLEDVRA